MLGEDRPSLRARVRGLLQGAGWEVIGEVGCAEDALGVLSAAVETGRPPDVVLIDVQLPGGGVRAAAEITVDSDMSRCSQSRHHKV